MMMLYPLMDSKGKIYVAVNERCLMDALFPGLGMYGSAKKKRSRIRRPRQTLNVTVLRDGRCETIPSLIGDWCMIEVVK